MNRLAKSKNVSRILIPLFILFCTVLTCGPAFAQQAPSEPEIPISKMFWVTVVIVTVFFCVLMLTLMRGLAGSQTWSLADALSEEADPQPSPPTGKPVMVASSSRLIAMLGLIVELSLFLGVGYYLLWALFTGRDFKTELEGVTSYFYAGVVLFAPYIVNKFSDAFSIFKPSAVQISQKS